MEIIFREDCLKELYKEGKTEYRKYKTLQKDIVKRFIKTTDILKTTEKIETLFLFNSLNYEKPKGDKKGIEPVGVNDKCRIEFIGSIVKNPPNTITVCSIIELDNHYQ